MWFKSKINNNFSRVSFSSSDLVIPKMTKENNPIVCVPLGHPLPLDEHACSVSLPTWCSIVGYEEGNPIVTSKMGCGYPRFVYHPYVLKLMDFALELDSKTNAKKGDWDCILLPGEGSAYRARDFLIRALSMEESIPLSSNDNALPTYTTPPNQHTFSIRVLKLPTQCVDVYALIFPAMTNAAIQAKSYWQHTGEVVSSRRAEVALIELNVTEFKRVTPDCISDTKELEELEGLQKCPMTQTTYTCLHSSSSSHNPADKVKERISSIVSQSPSSVFLAPSGMAAIYQALRSARRKRLMENKSNHGGTVIVYGFPYLDTLKMCGRPELVPDGFEFFGHGDSNDLQTLEQMLEALASNNPNHDAGVSALITEFPSNPLLNIHDLSAIRRLANKYNFAVIVDDTVSCLSNVDLLHSGIADVVCTSLTKLFNGRGDAMAGSIIMNEQTTVGQWMKKDLQMSYENNGEDQTLYPGDTAAIHANSNDFLERSHTINQTSEQLADWFQQHPDIQHIYYPKFSQPDLYNCYLTKSTSRHTPGYGGLMSILVGSHICQRTFYDTLPLSKGPSLGTNFTLICPYTLLAHYHELEFARKYNVSPNLIRIAVGLEPIDQIKNAFELALDKGRLHPKLEPLQNTGTLQQQRSYCTYAPTVMRPYSNNTYSWNKWLWNGMLRSRSLRMFR